MDTIGDVTQVQMWFRGGNLAEKAYYSSCHMHADFVVECVHCFTVTGEANFNMDNTRLTIGGFTQPGVARHLMELASNTEKGLSHRFLWLFPKPLYGKFESLSRILQMK